MPIKLKIMNVLSVHEPSETAPHSHFRLASYPLKVCQPKRDSAHQFENHVLSVHKPSEPAQD